MKRINYFLFAALLIAAACQPRVSGSFETIEYVRHIAQDTTGHEYRMIRRFNPRSSEGAIAVIGEPDICIYLAEKFLWSDRFDNITGRPGNDRLPDFAGETIAAYLDVAGSPYSACMGGKEALLRKTVVQDALFAMDTVCRINTFNVEATTPKPSAKVIVLSSSLTRALGYPDVDTLFKMASRPIPVVTPVGALTARAFENAPKLLNVGVWTDEITLSSGAFQEEFRRKAAAAPDLQPTLNIFSPGKDGDLCDRFYKFLDTYLREGLGFPLSVLLIDDYGVDRDVLDGILADIRQMETPDMVKRNKLLAPDFRFVDATEAVTSEVYRLLRTGNLFTHDIAYPRLKAYQMAQGVEEPVLIHSDAENTDSLVLEFIKENTYVAKKSYGL